MSKRRACLFAVVPNVFAVIGKHRRAGDRCRHGGSGEPGGNAGAVLNAANEVAVAAFLDRKIRFTDIARINEETLGRTTLRECVSLEEYRRTDREARQTALSML